MNAANASLGPQERLILVYREVGAAANGKAMGLRWRLGVESDAFPVDAPDDLDELDFGGFAKAVQSPEDLVVLEFGVLVDRNLAG